MTSVFRFLRPALVGCFIAFPMLALGQDGSQPGPAQLPAYAEGGSSEARTEPGISQDTSPRWDPAMVSAGEAAFRDNCLQCHDANRSLEKKKGLASWRATIDRMATKDGADIPRDTWEPIAVYLTSLHQSAPRSATGTSDMVSDEPEEDPFAVFATLSPLWRGGSSEIQNPGFFPDIWVGAAWQSRSSPISGRVTACISCHTEPGLGNRIELVEAVFRLDLTKWISGGGGSCERQLEMAIEAGRLVVPFGAFSKQSNPGVYRTVSKPLIYNMGQRVFDEDLGDPVLPMPYSDEGLNLSVSQALGESVMATGDFYVINGLQGGDDGIDFDMSRDYVDNNSSPAVGARGTIGNQALKLGGSIMGGRFNDNSGASPDGRGLNYWIYGADATYRYEDIFRVQFEYAQRDNDRVVNLPNQMFSRDRVGGYYVESELLVSRRYQVSLIGRYDIQTRHSLIPPGGTPSGNFDVSRFTYGLNSVLPGGSLLMFNVEHWFLPSPFKDLDVVGVRWAATF